MKYLFSKDKNTKSVFGLLLFSIATFFCLYAQEEPFEDLDL